MIFLLGRTTPFSILTDQTGIGFIEKGKTVHEIEIHRLFSNPPPKASNDNVNFRRK